MKTYHNLFILLIFFCNISFSQQKESLYVFNSNWDPTTIDSARFLVEVKFKNDSCWQYDYYNFTGPLLYTEQYRDHEGKVLHGVTRYYNSRGLVDSMGSYNNGKMHGEFYKLLLDADTMRYQRKYIYMDDKILETIDMEKKEDGTKYPDEVESEFPGGASKWKNFLINNLKYPERAVNGNFEGVVRVTFIVDADGKVRDPYISRSVEYSLDKESIRMIQLSGKWIPAFQNGRHVKSYKVQPIIFRLQ